MNELIGKRITNIEISNNESAMRFTTDGGVFVYLTEGDCCSETWFSEILNLDNLINHTVASVEELQLPHYDDGNTRQEYDSFYGYQIITDAGHCTIVFRSSSNGYYGGSCGLAKEGEIEKYHKDIVWSSIANRQDWTAYDVSAPTYKFDTKEPTHSYYRYLKCAVLM